MSVNKVILVGRLGADPELITTSTGTTLCNLRLATNEKYNGKTETEWHRVVCFNKRAEAVAKHKSKGDQLYIEGRLRTESWEDGDGNKRYFTSVTAAVITFL